MQDDNKKRNKVVVSVGKSIGSINRTSDGERQNLKRQEEEAKKIREEILEKEKNLSKKVTEYDNRAKELEKKAISLEKQKDSLEKNEKETEKVREELVVKLQKISSLTTEEAKQLILENVEKQIEGDIVKRLKEAEEKIKAEADAKARDILINAMIAGATDWVAEYTVTTVRLDSEEMKGRIIGKEGRNIRSFELATGVDVELDSDDPREVRIASFDPIRREVAKIALEWLVKDARIQPTRIEQLVEKAQDLVARDMSEAGRRAAHELGLFSLGQETVDILGRLKFRYSYGQNQLIASLETGKIAKKLAVELGANEVVAAMGGLFHDIGKTQVDKEGTHIQLGVELAKKWGFPQAVVDCIAQHHEDEPFSSVESIIVHLADASSGARPGARHEPVEQYLKRLAGIEKIATEQDGVEKAYAIQAGREIRVIVNPQVLDDDSTVKLSQDIRQKLESELTYPGQITVTVIREFRAVDIAK